MDLPVLNFPAYEFQIRLIRNNPHVYDAFRKKYVALTPEEWVRQHAATFLVEARGYPRGLIHIEAAFKMYQATRRCDILIYTPDMKPLLVTECKSPDVAISEATFDQVSAYNSVIAAPLLLITNGLSHFCCRIGPERKVEFLADIPRYEEAP